MAKKEFEEEVVFDGTDTSDSKSSKKSKKKEKKPSKKSSNKKKKVENSQGVRLPKTAQDTVPFVGAYRNGIIESTPNYFTRSYKLHDLNFSIAPQEEQERIFTRYQEFLNSFSDKINLQLVINNRNADENSVVNSIMCQMEQDNYNYLREEYNAMLREKMSEGKNNLISDKYLVIGTKSASVQEANITFNRLDNEIDDRIKNIANTQTATTIPQTIQERLKALHDIMNIGNESNLSEDIDFNALARAGLSVKDVIAPAGFKFDNDKFYMGDKICKVLFIKTLPSSLSTDFINDMAQLPFNMTASFLMRPIAQNEAMTLVKNNLTAIRGNVIEAEKNAYKAGYGADLISPELKYAQEQAEFLLDDMRNKNQKLFYFTGTVMLYADTLEELQSNVDSVTSLSNKHMCFLDKLLFQQEYGFRETLPLCRADLPVNRLMTTESAAVFIPFSTKELLQKNGMYYGLNAVSKNLLVFDRLSAKNQNGLILGVPGSGKSFSAKREMINVFLTTPSYIYVIDPESEYAYMCELLGGSVIHLEPGSKYYINPFDMDLKYAEGEDAKGSNPVTMKSDYICMLCETAMGSRYEITNAQKSIIDRCVHKLYEPYLEHMRQVQKTNPSITCDVDASPIMDDFYELLIHQPEIEAQTIALSIELYCRGSLDTFARRTNVDVNNRFVVYDIKDIGNSMKEMGVQVCLNHIWNKIIANQSKNIRTWFYIDEFHVLTKTRSSSNFLMQIWKRARKWGGVPTAITQNVNDMLHTEEALAIIENCEFIMMLSQSPIDRAQLADMYGISDQQLNYITNSPPGQGLIYNGEAIIPFVDKFPKNTQLYSIMSSKPGERKMQADAEKQ